MLLICLSPLLVVFGRAPNKQVVCLERREGSSSVSGPDDDGVADVDVDAEESAMKPPARRRQGWEWSLGSMRREHTHDVHAMAIHQQSLDGNAKDGGVGVARKGPVLVSGGVDASLTLYSVPGFKTYVSELCELCEPCDAITNFISSYLFSGNESQASTIIFP